MILRVREGFLPPSRIVYTFGVGWGAVWSGLAASGYLPSIPSTLIPLHPKPETHEHHKFESLPAFLSLPILDDISWVEEGAKNNSWSPESCLKSWMGHTEVLVSDAGPLWGAPSYPTPHWSVCHLPLSPMVGTGDRVFVSPPLYQCSHWWDVVT